MFLKHTVFWEYKIKRKEQQELEQYFRQIKEKLTDKKKVADILMIYWAEKKVAYGNVRFINPLFYTETFIKRNPEFVFVPQVGELNIVKDRLSRPHEFYSTWQLGNSSLRKNMEKLLLLI